MLQQTQTARVIGPFGAFLRRFPTPEICARAGAGEVLRAWSGLGYNRRALNLHACAVAIVDRHEGKVPDRLEDLQALPGIGPYTARAVLAFAFEQQVAVVDLNVRRVLSRALAGRRLSAAEAQGLAERLVPAGRSWLWNQAMLEHGALCCTARAPRCGDCFMRSCCAWRRTGCAAPDPGAPLRSQGRFEGSDRQGRGRLVAALRRGGVAPHDLAAACGWPGDLARARRAADALVREGLATWGPGGVLHLGGTRRAQVTAG